LNASYVSRDNPPRVVGLEAGVALAAIDLHVD
jgi:hypothetical protein